MADIEKAEAKIIGCAGIDLSWDRPVKHIHFLTSLKPVSD